MGMFYETLLFTVAQPFTSPFIFGVIRNSCLPECQIDGKSALRRMRNSGRRSREGTAKTSSGGKGNATDGDDDDDDDEEDGEDDDDVAVCAAAEGTSSGAISVVEAIVKQKVLDEVCSANLLLIYSL